MDAIQKFCSDLERIKKRVGAGQAAVRGATELFERNNRACPSLARSFADYWATAYAGGSPDADGEPTPEHCQKLAAMQALIDGEPELTQALSDSDWKELCRLATFEADEVPLDTLNAMMSLFVEHHAL